MVCHVKGTNRIVFVERGIQMIAAKMCRFQGDDAIIKRTELVKWAAPDAKRKTIGMSFSGKLDEIHLIEDNLIRSWDLEKYKQGDLFC